MTHKLRWVRAEEYAYCVNKLRQNVGLERWTWRQIVTSQRANSKYKWLPYATDRNPHENFLRTPLNYRCIKKFKQVEIGQFWNLKSKIVTCFIHPNVLTQSKTVAYAENFHGGVSISGIWWSFAFAVRSVWRHNLMSYSSFQTNILAKFVEILCIFFYTHSL